MAQNEFQIGDVVKLKVSDQKFVVSKIDNNMINCVMWNVDTMAVAETGWLDYRLFMKI